MGKKKKERVKKTLTKRPKENMGKKRKERVKKTLTKRPKEKREKKRKMVRERRKRKAMTKFCFCCHPTSSFRTTYTKYATSSSSLLSKKGARRDRLRQFEKKNPNPTREMPDQSLSKTTEHPL